MSGANCLEALTPIVPHLFLPLASVSNILKNVSCLAQSATRAHIHREFSAGARCAQDKGGENKENNIGDITGKSASQGTLAGLLGTAVGLGMLAEVIPALEKYWNVSVVQEYGSVMGSSVGIASFCALNVISILSAYESNRVFVDRTLNQQRGETVFKEFIESWLRDPKILIEPRHLDQSDISLRHPADIGMSESFLRKFHSQFPTPLISSNDIKQGSLTTFACNDITQDSYIIGISRDHGKAAVVLSLIGGTGPHSTVVLRGFYHSCILRHLLSTKSLQHVTDEKILILAHELLSKSFNVVFTKLQAIGWGVEYCYFNDCIKTTADRFEVVDS
jgi:hypothetical protein